MLAADEDEESFCSGPDNSLRHFTQVEQFSQVLHLLRQNLTAIVQKFPRNSVLESNCRSSS